MFRSVIEFDNEKKKSLMGEFEKLQLGEIRNIWAQLCNAVLDKFKVSIERSQMRSIMSKFILDNNEYLWESYVIA